MNTVSNREIVFAFKKRNCSSKTVCADFFRHRRFGGCSPFSRGSQQQDLELFADRWNGSCLSVALHVECQEVVSRPENLRECPRAYFFIPVFIWVISGWFFPEMRAASSFFRNYKK